MFYKNRLSDSIKAWKKIAENVARVKGKKVGSLTLDEWYEVHLTYNYNFIMGNRVSNPEDDEIEEVVKLMRECYPSVVDWNVISDDEVHLLNKDGKVVRVIDSDELDDFWNEVEGVSFMFNKKKGD